MQAWFDESGGKGQGGYLTLGGLIGEAEEWAAFSDEWAQELTASRALGYLSMSDAALLGGEFHRWAAWERDAKVRRLAAKVNGFHFTLIHCSVDLVAHQELFPSVPARRKGKAVKRLKTFADPYFLCFHLLCTAVCVELMKRHITQRFELFFDENDVMAPRVKEWYPIYLSQLRPEERAVMPIEPLFRDDKEFMPLQAADLVAYVIRSDLSKIPHPFHWIWKTMRGLTQSRYSQIWDRQRLLRELTNDALLQPHEQDYKRKLEDFLEMPPGGPDD